MASGLCKKKPSIILNVINLETGSTYETLKMKTHIKFMTSKLQIVAY